MGHMGKIFGDCPMLIWRSLADEPSIRIRKYQGGLGGTGAVK